jgi:hypothetical protein
MRGWRADWWLSSSQSESEASIFKSGSDAVVAMSFSVKYASSNFTAFFKSRMAPSRSSFSPSFLAICCRAICPASWNVASFCPKSNAAPASFAFPGSA